MTVDIKENSLISRETVKNCNSSNRMIVTLIPFLLAARLESLDSEPSRYAPEVTYLVENHATTHHSDASNSTNMNFHLRTLLSCQNYNASLYCYFQNVQINSTPRDVNHHKQRKYVIEDSWSKKILLQDIYLIAYEKNGKAEVWIPKAVDSVGRDMIATIVRLLIVDVDLSIRQIGNFEIISNGSVGNCRTKYFVTQSSPPLKHQSSIMNLFLIPQPDKSLASPLEIARLVEDPKCVNNANSYSFWANRELRKAKEMDIEAELISAENFMIMKNHNLSSFSKIKTTIINHKDKTKYVIDESISLTLQDITTSACPHYKDENSSSQKDYSSEEKNVFIG